MGCHPGTVKLVKHLCALMFPKNSSSSGVTNLWPMRYLPGQLTPPSPRGLLSMLMWDSTAYQTSSLFPATSLTPVVLKGEITFPATRTRCLPHGPPWFEDTRQRVSGFLALRAPDTGCLGFRFLRHLPEGLWICSCFFPFSRSSPLMQAADAASSTPPGQEWRSTKVLNKPLKYDCQFWTPLTFHHCSLKIIRISSLGESMSIQSHHYSK